MCNLRVKLTYTFSAVRVAEPAFISVMGLTAFEMPNNECIVIKIKRLCIGRDSVYVGAEKWGQFCSREKM